MPLVAAYHRPDSLDQALSLLAQPHRVPLAGGTVLNADRAPSDIEVVDLQALGLDDITVDGDRIRVGATATLGGLAGAEELPPWIQSIARDEAPSTLRTLATVGGTVAAMSADSVLLAAFLVSETRVELAGADDRSLPDLLSGGVPEGALITAITLDPAGVGTRMATGRTPADVPIVAAVTRFADDTITLALTGVAATPVLADPSDPGAGLTPVGDFRGSAEYRLELARVLATRAAGAVR